MTKRKSFFPKILLAFSTLILPLTFTSCDGDSKTKISFGTFIDDECQELPSFQKVIDKINITHEAFILAVHPTNGCGCWDEFKPILDRFASTAHVKSYSVANTLVKEAENKYGFEYSESAPILYFVNKDNKKTKIDYYSSSTSPFAHYDYFVQLFEKYCSYPQIYLVNEEYLDNNLANKEEQIVHYVWESCPDCQDSFPYVVFPYVNNHELNNPIWAWDLDAIKSDTVEYTRIRNKFHMSNDGDATFGYLNGKVPTTQYYENGVLKDMNVYFNDQLSQIDGKYYVTSTYFTPERIPHLNYVDETANLLNKELPSEQVTAYGSWKKDYAREYHAKYLNAFLDMYAK